ncbi:MAG TPA: hypothetical protein V6D47_02640 [Oscillatoriaceae cyanobacterium]
MGTLDDLHRMVDAIPEGRREEARVLLAGLIVTPSNERNLTDKTGDELLAEIAADPALKAKFDAMLARETAAMDRGEGIDGETFMAELLAGLPEE